jgi:sterol desaturase/sphingolipid hydroxylase (fatty acid hydroxylase superfamily)
MKSSVLYRIASILLLAFAIGHTLGFRQVDPKWRIDALIQSMRSVHFNVNGFDRTYWDFFVGFGLFVTALMLLASLIAWQFGSLPAATLASMRISTWGFVLCFAFVAFLSWRYFFLVPVIFSIVILVCLTLAAWLSGSSR